MTGSEKPKNKGGRPRKHPVGTRVPTLAFRVRAGLRDKLEASAERNERSISEEIERRLEQSFADAQTILNQRDQLSAFGTNAHETAVVKAFAALLRATQKRHRKSWREGDCIPWVVTEVIRRVMVSQTRSPLFEALAPFGRTAEAEAEAELMGEVARDVFTFPALPELAAQDDPQNWTGRGRHVVTFKKKASGEILDTVTVREGAWNELASLPSSPEYLAVVEKYRPQRDEIEVEDSFVHVLKSEQSVWDRPAAPITLMGEPAAAPIVAVQADAISNRPAVLFDKADFDEIMSDRPRDDGEGPQGNGPGTPEGGAAPAIPASGRRRSKAKA